MYDQILKIKFKWSKKKKKYNNKSAFWSEKAQHAIRVRFGVILESVSNISNT